VFVFCLARICKVHQCLSTSALPKALIFQGIKAVAQICGKGASLTPLCFFHFFRRRLSLWKLWIGFNANKAKAVHRKVPHK
jgi:hypothetical protein